MTKFAIEPGLAELHNRLVPHDLAKLTRAIEAATDFATAALPAGFTADEVTQLLRDCLVPAAVFASLVLRDQKDPLAP